MNNKNIKQIINNNKIIIAGAGPGSADLITIRAVNAIKNADIVIYAGSLVNKEILQYANKNIILHNSATMNLDEVIGVMTEGYNNNQKIVRLHTGDPAIYGAINEQMSMLDQLNIPYEVIPGVSSALATAAELKTELTMPGITQSVIFTRKAGRTPVPDGEDIVSLAKNNNATFAVFLSVNMIDDLINDFYQAGRTTETAIAIVYRATWENQKIIRGTLGDIAKKVKNEKINRQAMIIVGDVLKRTGDKSLLYDDNFAHGYRNNLLKELKNIDNLAIFSLTKNGAFKALEIATALSEINININIFIPDKFKNHINNDLNNINREQIIYFSSHQLSDVINDNFHQYSHHIFIMATGIVVRKIAPLISDVNNIHKNNKLNSPAVVCCDEKGDNVISLLSGHVGGANKLAKVIAGITMGNAVITTATDVNNIKSFDELATENNYIITDKDRIKLLNSLLLENGKIGVIMDNELFQKYYGKNKFIELITNNDIHNINIENYDGLVVCDDILDDKELKLINDNFLNKILILKRKFKNEQ